MSVFEQLGLRIIGGLLKPVGNALLRDRAAQDAPTFWAHLRIKHPEWFDARDFTFVLDTDEQDEIPIIAFANALRCAGTHGKCRHKP